MEENKQEENKTIRVKLVRHEWPDEKATRVRKQKQIMISILVGVLIFVSGFAVSSIMSPKYISVGGGNSKYSSIYEIMNNMWYFGKDVEDLDEKLIDGAISGMVNAGGDVHTQYMGKEATMKFMSSMEGVYVGIGISYYNLNGNFIIDKVFDESPAKAAGLLPGDIVVSIDGKSLEGLDSITDLVVGSEGTLTKFRILRGKETLYLEIPRAEVFSSVNGYVRDDVGILEISTFAERTGYDVGRYLERFNEENIDYLIIDLRKNTGGYLTATVDIGSLLMPKDSVILKEEKRDGSIKEMKTKSEVTPYEFKNIAILVDGQTASASEVLTAALRESCDAKVIGTLTYGKGTVQVSVPFKDGSNIKYTVAQWLTPNGDKINGIGITPDEIVENPIALIMGIPDLEGKSYKVDSVSNAAISAQTFLAFLGYSVDRTDGYFSAQSAEAIKQFQQDHQLAVTGVIDDEVLNELILATRMLGYAEAEKYDIQLNRAMEVVHGK